MTDRLLCLFDRIAESPPGISGGCSRWRKRAGMRASVGTYLVCPYIYFNDTSTGWPGRRSAASAGAKVASIMYTRVARLSRL